MSAQPYGVRGATITASDGTRIRVTPEQMADLRRSWREATAIRPTLDWGTYFASYCVARVELEAATSGRKS